VRKVLERAGLSVGDVDLFELNEAFAAQSLAVIRELASTLPRQLEQGTVRNRIPPHFVNCLHVVSRKERFDPGSTHSSMRMRIR